MRRHATSRMIQCGTPHHLVAYAEHSRDELKLQRFVSLFFRNLGLGYILSCIEEERTLPYDTNRIEKVGVL
jgi:hypothetical protein